MKLIINKFSIVKDFNSVNDLFDFINIMLDESQYELDYFIIDGKKIDCDYFEYLDMNLDQLSEIEVIIKDLKTRVDEILITSNEYMANAIFSLKSLANEFYQMPGSESWSKLVDLIEGIQWLLATQKRIDEFVQLDRLISDYEVWNEYVQIMKNIEMNLPEFENAIINKDTVLIGDLISYEIQPIFKNAIEKLSLICKQEGDGHAS